MTQPSDPPPSEIPIRPRHIRAPQGDGEALIEPPVSTALANANLERHVGNDFQRRAEVLMARGQLLHDAIEYTEQYSGSTGARYNSSTKLILAGHQPELFHPGVWLKNFVLDRCQIQNALAINLIIDNDVAQHTSIRIPTGDPQRPQTAEVSLDEPAAAIPYEERPIVSLETVSKFPARLREQFDPRHWYRRDSVLLLADDLWSHTAWRHAANYEIPLGLLLAQARHRLEQDLGLRTLELPLSRIAQTDSFRKFALHIFLNLPRFQEIYNRSLAEFRIVNKIRSHSHPVPALGVDQD